MNPLKKASGVRRGAVLIYALVSMTVLVVFISFAVDLGRVQLAKTELQAATDAAARYGAAGLNGGVSAVKTRITTAAAENLVDGTPLIIDPNADIEFGTWNAATRTFTVLTGPAQASAKAVRVTGRRISSRGTGVPLPFGRFFGLATLDVSSSCVADCATTTDDVFLIQDITTSFALELPDAKLADKALLDTLYAGGGLGRLAVAVHTGWGLTLAPLTRISGNYTYLTSKINSIQLTGSPGMPIPSGTDIASGFDEAIAAYTAAGYVVPAGGNKTVVLVSDGQPSNSFIGKHPTLSDSQLLTLAQTRANTLWANKVHIYVVFMDASNDTVAAANLQSLVRGNGDYIRVTAPAQLPAALTDITNKIAGVHITN